MKKLENTALANVSSPWSTAPTESRSLQRYHELGCRANHRYMSDW